MILSRASTHLNLALGRIAVSLNAPHGGSIKRIRKTVVRQVMPGRSSSGPAAAAAASSSSASNLQSVRLACICLAIATVFTLCWMALEAGLVLLYVGNVAAHDPFFVGSLLRWLEHYD